MAVDSGQWPPEINLTADHLVFLLQIVYSRVITGQTFIPFLHLIENTCSDVSQSGSVYISIKCHNTEEQTRSKPPFEWRAMKIYKYT